jgi:hypothetical protein
LFLSRRAFAATSSIAIFTRRARADDIPSPVPGKRVALRGYDPVGYFTDGRPIQGMPQYWYEFDDTVYLFANSAHRAAFIADPDHYAPQYQVYCAMAVSIGLRDEGLPDVWTIVDGKRFVIGRPNGLQDLAVDPTGTIARGQANWAATHPK